MSLNTLRPWFDAISDPADPLQLTELHGRLIDDFVTNAFTLGGKNIKIDQTETKIAQYKPYCETFFHLVTRKSQFGNARFFTPERANRIHWIKPILISHPTKQVLYFKWRDQNLICKEHFWLFSKDFLVVTRDIGSDVKIVTAFCVDQDMKQTLHERYANYRDGKSDC